MSIFNEKKTTQAAALLLEMNRGSMRYMKLVKLLYFIDRKSLLDLGRPVTFDNYAALPKGPIVSQTLNLITEGVEPGQESYWYNFISEKKHFSVKLKRKPPKDELSEAEIDLIKEIFDENKHLDQWQTAKKTEQLPEWEDPHGSSFQITYRDILMAEGRSSLEIKQIEDELNTIALANRILA